MDEGFQTLTGASAGTGWTLAGQVGYYIHRSRLYLQGEILSTASAGTTLLTGLPAPPTDLPVTIQADRFSGIDVATPGITRPVQVAATIDTGGSLILDSLPAYINTPPASPPYSHTEHIGGVDTTKPDFPDAFVYKLVLGNTSWPIDAAPPSDAPSWTSLASLLAGGDFTDIDSGYAVHDARVHLRGRVSANVDAAGTLVPTLPAPMKTALSAVDDSYTIGQGPATKVVLDIEGATAVLAESAYDARPGTASLGGLQPFIAGLRNLARWGGSNVGTAGSSSEWMQGLGSDGAELVSHGFKASWDNGTFLCGANVCAQGGGGPTVTFSIADLLAAFYPQPDWFLVNLNMAGGPFANPVTPYQNGCSGGSCGPQVWAGVLTLTADADCDFVYVAAATHTFANPLVMTNSVGWDIDPSVPEFPLPLMVLRPSAEYAGDPANPNTARLWKPGELTTITYDVGGTTHSGDLVVDLELTAYYEVKEDYLKAGDILDLTGAGWESAFTPPPPVDVGPGVMVAGAHQSGFIRRGSGA